MTTNSFVGKKITAKQAQTIPEGSIVRCPNSGLVAMRTRGGTWLTSNGVACAERAPLWDTAILDYCPDPAWKPEGEKVEEYFVNVYAKSMDFGGVLSHKSLKHADARWSGRVERIAILHVHDGIAELLDVGGKARSNPVRTQCDDCKSERDLLKTQLAVNEKTTQTVCSQRDTAQAEHTRRASHFEGLLKACEKLSEACGKANSCASLPDYVRELCRDAKSAGVAAIRAAKEIR